MLDDSGADNRKRFSKNPSGPVYTKRQCRVDATATLVILVSLKSKESPQNVAVKF